MRRIIAGLSLAALSTAAFAGSYVAPNVDTTIIEPPQTMGGSGGWIIPLVILGVLVLALTPSEAND